jgi:branched-chain amino acid transport system substrate-binding protein
MLVGAMKALKWEKPARPGFDRPRHARHRAEHLHRQGREGDGELYNVEFATFEAVKNPGKTSP